jgi:hypothetical protein
MSLSRGTGLTVAAVAATVLAAGSAHAVSGDPITDAAYGFVARISVGAHPDARGCTGALVAPQWIATARSCFGGPDVPLGAPATAATVTVGGHASPVVWLAPHPDRDVVLARLATPATGVTPVRVGTAAPAAGESLRTAGFGRTRTDWVPDRAHSAVFTVAAVESATLALDPAGDTAAVCKGDAGGPAVRETATGPELVALHYTSGQGGCLGAPDGAPRSAVETRVDDLAGWIRQTTVAEVGIYGVRPDGRLTYSVIDAPTGDRLTTVTSTAALGFTPKAAVALDPTTLLVTSTAGRLHRVDVTGNNPALTFAAPVDVAGGWTHDLLTYDGDGSLFGIAGSTLLRYTLTRGKPARPEHLIQRTVVAASGATLRTLTATGPDFVLGTTASGQLRSYRIAPAGTWEGADLQVASSWAQLTSLVSPGRGLYYGRTPAGGLQRFTDPTPYDLNGAGLQSFPNDPVDTAGWDATILAAVPFDAYPRNPVDTSVFGLTADGRLTFSAIDSDTGDRLATVTSAATLGFTPRAIATLNATTLLVTSTGGVLHRVDVIATQPSLVFAPPVVVGARGWTHRLLSYDGRGSLFGISGDSTLHRYTVTAAKPAAANITGNTVIPGAFTLTTLVASAPSYILGTTGAGELVGYAISGTSWDRHSLATGWKVAPLGTAAPAADAVTHLVSPGNGAYFARLGGGGMLRFRDASPTNGAGNDITAFPNDPVDTAGWTQIALSAQPYIS